MVLTYRNDVGCMWLNAITKQSLRVNLNMFLVLMIRVEHYLSFCSLIDSLLLSLTQHTNL